MGHVLGAWSHDGILHLDQQVLLADHMDNRQEVGMLVAQRQEQPEDRSLRASWLEQQEDHILLAHVNNRLWWRRLPEA